MKTAIIISLGWIIGTVAILLQMSCANKPDHIDKMFQQIEARAMAGAQLRSARP